MYNLLNGLINTLGRGTDRYTRTRTMSYIYNYFSQGGEQWVTIDNNEFHLYLTTPELRIVIDRFASMFSNGRFVVKSWKDEQEIENHPLLRLLENPNPLQSRNEFLMDLAVNHCLYGNAFIYRDNVGRVLESNVMYNLPAGRMKMKRSNKVYKQVSIEDMITAYILQEQNGNVQEKYEPKEILHLRRTNPDDPLLGLSPLHSLLMPISNIRGAYGFRNTLITKKGALGVLSGESSAGGLGIPFDERSAQELQKQWTDTHGIFDNQSKIMMTEAAVKWSPFSYPTKDMMLFEEVNDDLKRIIDAYGLNENLFSRDKASTFTNVLEGQRMAYQDTVIPFAENYCGALTQYMGLTDAYIELDYSHIPAMKDDEAKKSEIDKRKAETFAILINNGMSAQEARELLSI